MTTVRRARLNGIIAIACFLMTGLLTGCIPRVYADPLPARLDAIVVLGRHPPVLSNGQLHPELESRLERAIELWHQRVTDHIVFTGGGVESDVREARVMANFARDAGIPSDAMIIEDRSMSTMENAVFTAQRLCPNRARCAQRIALVTSQYHLDRARSVFSCLGFQVTAIPAEDRPHVRLRSRIREMLVRAYYESFELCDRLRSMRRANASRSSGSGTASTVRRP